MRSWEFNDGKCVMRNVIQRIAALHLKQLLSTPCIFVSPTTLFHASRKSINKLRPGTGSKERSSRAEGFLGK